MSLPARERVLVHHLSRFIEPKSFNWNCRSIRGNIRQLNPEKWLYLFQHDRHWAGKVLCKVPSSVSYLAQDQLGRYTGPLSSLFGRLLGASPVLLYGRQSKHRSKNIYGRPEINPSSFSANCVIKPANANSASSSHVVL